MADRMTREQRSRCMSHIHGKDTSPEMIVRRYLFSNGYRYRLNVRKLPGTPDIVLPAWNTVIMVNGCFWHGHRNCPLYVPPKSNIEFWQSKIKRNIARDTVNQIHLQSLGWNVITVWECELSKARRGETLKRIENELKDEKSRHDADTSGIRRNRELYRKYRQTLSRRKNMLEAEIGELYPESKKIRKLSYKLEEL